MALPVHGGLDGLVTLLGGGVVCVAEPGGTIAPDRLTGLYHRDIRVLSAAVLRVDGAAPPLLSEARDDASTARHVFVLDANAHGDPTAILLHHRHVDGGLHDRFEVHVYAGNLRGARLELTLATDFAGLLTLKAGAQPPPPAVLRRGTVAGDRSAVRRWHAQRGGTALEITASGGPADDGAGTLEWTIDADAGASWAATVTARPVTTPMPRRPDADDRGHLVVRGATAWRPAVASALDDLRALRVDAADRDLSYLAAGAPWFMALFGRDSLLAAWMSLIGGTALALDVLDGLARYQGRTTDPATLEQPGRILHELRTGDVGVFGVPAGRPYFGAVDTSALFVMLLAEAYRWGADVDRVRRLLPAARAAVAWCLGDGDVDGDGFVEYVGEVGLSNQGWKDSGDAMVHADGTRARGPIAPCEVQAYLFRALLDLARLETDLGDAPVADELRTRAATLRERFVDSFWLADRSLIAMALDGDKAPLAVASSNAGHCLWTGVLPPDLAAVTARRLTDPTLATFWGLRTLAADETAYNPLSYHLGSIWPHDSAIGAAGLVRAGHTDRAAAITDGLLAACAHFGWRLPELFGGFDRHEVHFPVAYPVACSPQAWSAATPLLLLRTMLRLDPDVPAGVVHLAPVFPPDTVLEVTGIRLGGAALDLRIDAGTGAVTTVPAGLRLVGHPARSP